MAFPMIYDVITDVVNDVENICFQMFSCLKQWISMLATTFCQEISVVEAIAPNTWNKRTRIECSASNDDNLKSSSLLEH